MTEENTTEQVLQFDVMQILEMIPHRYPFMLVDRITECVPGKYSKGYKNLTFNEPFFQGHFPNNPIMPGVLQAEALAQLGAGILMTMPEYKGKLVVYAGIDNCRFKRIVRPGDKLEMEVELVKVKGPIIKSHGRATVDGKLAIEADMIFSVV
jgi:3-hydroxyacyl-[acyl-carrier-protein] dehydratase